MDSFSAAPSSPFRKKSPYARKNSFGSPRGSERSPKKSSMQYKQNSHPNSKGKEDYFEFDDDGSKKYSMNSPRRKGNNSNPSSPMRRFSMDNNNNMDLEHNYNAHSEADRFIPSRSNLDIDFCNYHIMKKMNDENSIPGTSGGIKESNSSSSSSSTGTTTTTGTPSQNRHHEEIFENADKSPSRRLLNFSEKKRHRTLESRVDPLSQRSLHALDFSMGLSSFSPKKGQMRSLPSAPSRILDAPNLVDDYYLNLLSWGTNNIIAVALQHTVYLWHASSGKIEQLCNLESSYEYVTSLQWSLEDPNVIAVGTSSNSVDIWDVGSGDVRKIRSLLGHSARVSSLSWNRNGNTLTSGGRDSMILHHDTRAANHIQYQMVGHQQEVCGLAWSPDGRVLASGGNENMLCIWDPCSTHSTRYASSNNTEIDPMFKLQRHQAAVKALAWCPFQRHVLASGGGTADRTIRIWDVNSGDELKCVDSGSQVCALQWSEKHKELLSSHGFSDNQLCLWKYPSMTKLKEFRGHTSRVLHLAKSPDGCTIVSAGADETLRFWDIFGTPSNAGNKGDPINARTLFDGGLSPPRSMSQGMSSLR